MGAANTWSTARLSDGAGRAVDVDVNGLGIPCEVPVDAEPEPAGATPFGLLAGSLSACTAMSVRTFLQRWHVRPGDVDVRVAFRAGSPPVMHRHVTVAAAVDRDLREQLSAALDSTPVTVLLRDSLTITTRLTTGARDAS
jgi:putative redox protein